MKSKSLRAVICTGILAAMSIVLGKLAAINIGDTLRFSFENLPIIIASVVFGPVFGGACGVIADVVGCIIRGYSLIPLITVSQCVMGIIPGVLIRYVFRDTKKLYCFISAFSAHIVCSMLIKTVALHIVYGNPYSFLLATRVPTYAVVGALEAYICAVLMQNKVIKNELYYTFRKKKKDELQRNS